MKTIRTSPSPIKAPKNFRELPAQVTISDGDGLFGTWHGSGVPTKMPCAACGNIEGNLQIYSNWGYSYPNGNSWNDAEILCGQCGQFTLDMDFTEG